MRTVTCSLAPRTMGLPTWAPPTQRGPEKGAPQEDVGGGEYRAVEGDVCPHSLSLAGLDVNKGGREQAGLPGALDAQAARPSQARRAGLRVQGRPSCSSRSGLALLAGLGRQGALGGPGKPRGPWTWNNTAWSLHTAPAAGCPARPHTAPQVPLVLGDSRVTTTTAQGHSRGGSPGRRQNRIPPCR